MAKKKEVRSNLTIENAEIVFKNFSGIAGQYNREGNRNFCVFLDETQAESLASDGWNVKWLKPREEGDQPQAYLQVTVNYNNVPPMITLIQPLTGRQILLDENSVGTLDFAEFRTVDMIITPYNWEMNGKHGVKAYLKTMYVTVQADQLAVKYMNTPDYAAKCEGPDCEPPWEEQ